MRKLFLSRYEHAKSVSSKDDAVLQEDRASDNHNETTIVNENGKQNAVPEGNAVSHSLTSKVTEQNPVDETPTVLPTPEELVQQILMLNNPLGRKVDSPDSGYEGCGSAAASGVELSHLQSTSPSPLALTSTPPSVTSSPAVKRRKSSLSSNSNTKSRRMASASPSSSTDEVCPGTGTKTRRRYTKQKQRHDRIDKAPVSGIYIIDTGAEPDGEERVIVEGDIAPHENVIDITDEARQALESIDNRIGDYICRLCSQRYENAFHLAQHRCSKIVHIEYRCTICSKCFNCPANLASHKRWHGKRSEKSEKASRLANNNRLDNSSPANRCTPQPTTVATVANRQADRSETNHPAPISPEKPVLESSTTLAISQYLMEKLDGKQLTQKPVKLSTSSTPPPLLPINASDLKPVKESVEDSAVLDPLPTVTNSSSLQLPLHVLNSPLADVVATDSPATSPPGLSESKALLCPHCCLQMPNSQTLQLHIVLVHPFGLSVCHMCKLTFFSAAEYLKHLLAHQLGDLQDAAADSSSANKSALLFSTARCIQ